MEKLINLYRAWCGRQPRYCRQLSGAGSNRTYIRITGGEGQTVIGVIGTSRDENHAFVSLARHFTNKQLPVPEILAVSSDELRYLQTDLGDVSLFDAIRGGRDAGGRYNQHEKQLLVNAIKALPDIQIRGAQGLDLLLSSTRIQCRQRTLRS